MPSGTKIRSNKKFSTSVKPTSAQLSSTKLRKSDKNVIVEGEDSASPKPRKSAKNFTVKNTLKKKSILLNSSKKLSSIPKAEKKKSLVGTKKKSLTIKPEKKSSIFKKDENTSKKSIRPSTSLFKENNASNRNPKKAKTSIKNPKSAKKSIELGKKFKNKKKSKENIVSSETSNKNEINTINSVNDSNISNSEDSKIKSKSNQDNEKEIKEEKSPSKKDSIKPDRIPININNHNNQNGLNNNKIPNEYYDNKPANVNLIKEINDKPNYRYEYKYDVNNNMNSQELDGRLKNYKIESSDYITEKNKNMMRNLIHLLERKPESKKQIKNIFRSSLNNLLSQENNKLLESLTRTKNDIFRIVQDEKLSYINQAKANSRLYDIYKALFEQNNNLKNKYERSWNTSQNPFIIKQNYFFNYVDNRHPNMDQFPRYNSSSYNINNNRMSYSYDKNYHVMGKNNLKVENRDNRYLSYDYDSMINSLNNKLNKDFRQIYRKRRMENLMENINYNIHAMNPREYFGRKTFD